MCALFFIYLFFYTVFQILAPTDFLPRPLHLSVFRLGCLACALSTFNTYLALPLWLCFPGCSDCKIVCLQSQRPGFSLWVGKIPRRRKWQPTPVFLPGKFHGRRNLMGYSPWVPKSWTQLSNFTFTLAFTFFPPAYSSFPLLRYFPIRQGAWRDSYLLHDVFADYSSQSGYSVSYIPMEGVISSSTHQLTSKEGFLPPFF